MKKYSKYGLIRKLLQDFDMFKSPANLRMKQEPDSSQYCSGIFSVLLFGFFIYVIIFQLTKVLKYEQIITATSVQTSSNFQQPSASNILFAVSPAILKYEQWSPIIAIFVQLQIQYINQTDESLNFKKQNVSMQRCRKQQWQNFSNIYTDYRFSEMLCPKNPELINIGGLNSMGNLTSLSIIVKRRSQNQKDPNNWIKNIQFLDKISNMSKNDTNYLSFYIIDTSISADRQNPLNQFIRLNYQIQYNPQTYKQMSLYLGTYTVETDKSLLPYQKMQTLEGYFINSKIVDSFQRIYQFFQQINYGNLGSVRIMMTNKKKIFKRTIGKIDQVISYAGGLFGILIGFCAFIMNSYNEYSYELKVAEASFNYDQHGNQLKQKHFNFFKYIKFSIYDWVKFMFCYQINWTYDKKKDQTRQQAINTMDVMNLFKKIQINEILLEYIYDKNELILLNLIKKPTIQQARRKRQRLQYYNKVIRGQIAINIQDIIHTKQSLKKYQEYMTKRQYITSMGILIQNLNKNRTQQQIKSERITDRKYQSHQNHVTSQTIMMPLNIRQIIKKKFIKYSGIQNEIIISKIAEYTQIQNQAKQLKLSQQMLKIQEQFAMAYQSLNQKIKNKIGARIPLKILHRLFDCLQRKYTSLDSNVRLTIQQNQ